MGLGEWAYWVELKCPHQANFLTPYLQLTHNTTIFITVSLWVLGVFLRELWLFLFGIGITVNWLVNVLLQSLFQQPVPYGPCGMDRMFCIDAAAPLVHVDGDLVRPNACGMPPWPDPGDHPGANCGAPPLDPCSPCVSCGMPAFEAQDTAFFVTSLFLFMYAWKHPHLTRWHVALLIAWLALVVWCHSFYGFNSPAQIVVGAGVGAVMALGWHTFVFVCAYPRFRQVLNIGVVSTLEYRNTLCEEYPDE